MLARGARSSAGSERYAGVKVDFSNLESCKKITVEEFQKMTLPQRIKLFQEYPEIYNSLVNLEKEGKYGR